MKQRLRSWWKSLNKSDRIKIIIAGIPAIGAVIAAIIYGSLGIVSAIVSASEHASALSVSAPAGLPTTSEQTALPQTQSTATSPGANAFTSGNGLIVNPQIVLNGVNYCS